MRKLIIALFIVLTTNIQADDTSYNCGESELYKKYSYFNYGDRKPIVKTIISDMKELDIDIIHLPEMEMEIKLREHLTETKDKYKIENQPSYQELTNELRELLEITHSKNDIPDDARKQTKVKINLLKLKTKQLREACIKESTLAGLQDEARRVMWYKYHCDNDIKSLCNRTNGYY